MTEYVSEMLSVQILLVTLSRINIVKALFKINLK